jgi:hypothetical protein
MVGAEAGHRPVSEAVQRPCTQFDLSDCISGPGISPWLPGSLAHSLLRYFARSYNHMCLGSAAPGHHRFVVVYRLFGRQENAVLSPLGTGTSDFRRASRLRAFSPSHKFAHVLTASLTASLTAPLVDPP